MKTHSYWQFHKSYRTYAMTCTLKTSRAFTNRTKKHFSAVKCPELFCEVHFAQVRWINNRNGFVESIKRWLEQKIFGIVTAGKLLQTPKPSPRTAQTRRANDNWWRNRGKSLSSRGAMHNSWPAGAAAVIKAVSQPLTKLDCRGAGAVLVMSDSTV